MYINLDLCFGLLVWAFGYISISLDTGIFNLLFGRVIKETPTGLILSSKQRDVRHRRNGKPPSHHQQTHSSTHRRQNNRRSFDPTSQLVQSRTIIQTASSFPWQFSHTHVLLHVGVWTKTALRCFSTIFTTCTSFISRQSRVNSRCRKFYNHLFFLFLNLIQTQSCYMNTRINFLHSF